MTIDSFLALFNNVRRSGKGWLARCPAHDDRRPSLSIREGERALLIHCWAGCSVEAICESLSIRVKDLFFNSEPGIDRFALRQLQWDRKKWKARERRRHQLMGLRMDAFREAERFLGTVTSIDISRWSVDRFATNLDLVCEALALLREEEGFYGEV